MAQGRRQEADSAARMLQSEDGWLRHGRDTASTDEMAVRHTRSRADSSWRDLALALCQYNLDRIKMQQTHTG